MAKPRVLILLDRDPDPIYMNYRFGISFATPDPTDNAYFSISHLISILDADLTLAHRSTDPARDFNIPTPVQIENFRFTPGSLSDIDEVWLIAYAQTDPTAKNLTQVEQASILDDSELAVLTTFMNEGGGVFAVGDHANLGVALCGRLPRVRSMRLWWWPSPGPLGEAVSPPPKAANGAYRLDTTAPGRESPPGANTVWFDDQSDDVPQYLNPFDVPDRCPIPTAGGMNPDSLHPLLQGVANPLLAFADHMHEGKVVVPSDLSQVFTFNGQQFQEYPSTRFSIVSPQIIAWSWTNGAISVVPASEMGVHQGDPVLSPYTFFGAIGVYDGHHVNSGRVVVESTFHHLLDINLIGDPQAPAGDPKQQGFLVSAEGRATLAGIEEYYNNVVTWLAPAHQAQVQWVGAAASAIRVQPLREMITFPPSDALLAIGELAVASARQSVRPGMLTSWLRALLPDAVKDALPALPWGPVSGTPGCGSMDYTTLLHAAFGGAVLELGQLRRHTTNLETVLNDPQAQQRIVRASLGAVATLAGDIERESQTLSRVARAFRSLEQEPHPSV